MTDERTVLALDVGGSGMKGVVVDSEGGVRRELARPTPVDQGPAAVVAAIRETTQALTGPDVAAVGAVVPGSVDVAAGVARYSANIGWRDVPLRDLLTADLGLPVILEHDVRAAGLAETVLGSARDMADCLVMIIGTGIAGVVRSQHMMVRGATDLAGEIGHIPVHPYGEVCACGQRGCLETYASAAAIARRYRNRSGRDADARDILTAADTDSNAKAVWEDATRALGIALATYTFLLDPNAIIIGGGLAEAGTALIEPVRAELARRLSWRPPPEVEISSLGARAGRLGAAVLAWQSLGRTDFDAWLRRD